MRHDSSRYPHLSGVFIRSSIVRKTSRVCTMRFAGGAGPPTHTRRHTRPHTHTNTHTHTHARTHARTHTPHAHGPLGERHIVHVREVVLGRFFKNLLHSGSSLGGHPEGISSCIVSLLCTFYEPALNRIHLDAICIVIIHFIRERSRHLVLFWL